MSVLTCVTWQENAIRYESWVVTYKAYETVNANAHERAETLIDMWAAEESKVTRFIDGKDHGAYVSDGHGIYRGIRITVD